MTQVEKQVIVVSEGGERGAHIVQFTNLYVSYGRVDRNTKVEI